MDVKIQADSASFRQCVGWLKHKQARLPVITSRAVNKVATWARTAFAKAVSKQVAIKQAAAKKAISLTRATYRKPVAHVRITGKRISLVEFPHRQTRKGVSYRIGKGGKRTLLPGGFLATMKSGHRGAFVREYGTGILGAAKSLIRRKAKTARRLLSAGKDNRVPRLPIREVRGPSIPGVIQKAEGLLAGILAEADKRLKMETERQVQVLAAQQAKIDQAIGGAA